MSQTVKSKPKLLLVPNDEPRGRPLSICAQGSKEEEEEVQTGKSITKESWKK